MPKRDLSEAEEVEGEGWDVKVVQRAMMREQWMNTKRDLSEAEEVEGEGWDVKVVAGYDEGAMNEC